MRRHRLIEVEWPAFGEGELPAPAEAAEFADRVDRTRVAMEAIGLTHLVVYSDREHFANLAWLTGFDPRFEEALLVLRPDAAPLLLVGNENVGRVHASPLLAEGALRSERYQPLSLLSQPRDESRLLRDILAGEGIGAGARVGCAGWKYFTEAEHPDARHAMEIPAYVVDTLRELAGREAVVNATALFMDPAGGLRTVCSATEVAYFEYASTAASEGMKRVILGLEEGITDLELARRFEYNGLPLSCHVGMKTPGNRAIGLTGPTGSVVRRGGPFSANFGYWGSNVCRVGWVARSAAELPEGARDYVEAFAGPYFEAMGEWLRMLRIGTPGGALAEMIQQRLPFGRFGVFLNPGHLIHLDEWVSSPIYPGSTDPLRSGMYLQSDVIPRSPIYFGTRMEDGYLLADWSLREEIRARYPGCYTRIQARRHFLIGTLGLEIGEEVLPLSNTAGLVPPFLLAPQRVLALEP